MTLEDTKKFLMMVNAFFPTWKVDNPVETANAWAWALGEFSPESVKSALQVYIRTNNSGFAPSVSQIIDSIYSLNKPEAPSEGEAWAMVRKAISDSTYHARERFDELPPIVQEAVGSPHVLRQWGQSEAGTSATQSNFQRAYREVVKRHEYKNKIPQNILEKLGENKVNLIGGE